jgi:hypothetical protein
LLQNIKKFIKLSKKKNLEIIVRKYAIKVKKILHQNKERKFQGFWMVFFQNKVKESINIKK